MVESLGVARLGAAVRVGALTALTASSMALAACGSGATKTVIVTQSVPTTNTPTATTPTTATTPPTATTPTTPAAVGGMSTADAVALLARFEQTWDEQNAPGLQYILTVDVTYAFDGNSRLNGYHDVRDHFDKTFFATAPPHGIKFTAIQVNTDSRGTYASGNYTSPDINGTTGTFRIRLQPPTPSRIRGDPCATNPCIASITFKPSGPLH